MAEANVGTVIAISGPAVDVQFDEARMPPIFEALTISSEGFDVPSPIDVTVEVQQHLGEGRVRCIAMEATEMSSLLGLVGAGAGIALVPTTVAQARSRYVVFRALSDRGADVELFQLLPARPVATAERLAAMLPVVR